MEPLAGRMLVLLWGSYPCLAYLRDVFSGHTFDGLFLQSLFRSEARAMAPFVTDFSIFEYSV
jgi:hypothetical protein